MTSRATVVNGKENAVNTRLRSTTRAKPTSTAPSTSDAKTTTLTRATASTVATRAKTSATTASRLDPAAQGKRKREALGEVPRPPANVQRDAPKDIGLKGKAKAKESFEGVVLKKPPSTTRASSVKPPSTTRATAKVATSSVTTTTTTSTRRTRSATQHVEPIKPQVVLEDVQEEDEEPEVAPHRSDAMAIDVPARAPVASPRRFTVARSSIAVATSRTQIKQRARQAAAAPVELDDEDDIRAYKKRRTSSEAPEDELLAEQQVEHAVELEPQEADPNGDQWVDLDAEDVDDPLMVSEYVIDIFNYLKEVEVRSTCLLFAFVWGYSPRLSKPPCRTRTTWRCKRISRGTCVAS